MRSKISFYIDKWIVIALYLIALILMIMEIERSGISLLAPVYLLLAMLWDRVYVSPKLKHKGGDN